MADGPGPGRRPAGRSQAGRSREPIGLGSLMRPFPSVFLPPAPRKKLPPGDSLPGMAYRIVDPATVAATPGPHPAASPFDKRVSEALGINAFEVYTVELPPDAETVRHDHRDDLVEDL